MLRLGVLEEKLMDPSLMLDRLDAPSAGVSLVPTQDNKGFISLQVNGIPSFFELLRKCIHNISQRITFNPNSILTACLAPCVFFNCDIFVIYLLRVLIISTVCTYFYNCVFIVYIDKCLLILLSKHVFHT